MKADLKARLLIHKRYLLRYYFRYPLLAFLVFIFSGCKNADSIQQESADAWFEAQDVSGKLNIILILADDMSYAIPADTAGRNLSFPNKYHPNKYSFTVHASHNGKTWNKPVVIRSDIGISLF